MACEQDPICEIGYDASHSKLLIRLVGGQEYIFVGVPEAVHRALCDAPDLASYVGERLLSGYPYNVRSAA